MNVVHLWKDPLKTEPKYSKINLTASLSTVNHTLNGLESNRLPR